MVDGGAVLLPVFHSIAMVNLNTLRLEVKRSGNESLITKDRLRADITVEFYVRVEPREESIALAAQTLGERTNDAMLLRELIEAKFVDALRAVAAGMTLPDLQEKRADFVKGVQEAVSGDLRHNGLELESASLTRLDQTSIEHFNPDNSFDAEGLARLKEITEQRRKERNATERDAEVAVAEKDRETALKQLEIRRTTREAQLAQERDIANKTAETRAETAQAEQRAQQSEETARIEREQAVRLREVEARQTSESARIAADLAIGQRNAEAERERQLILQDNAIKIAERSQRESEARAAARRPRPWRSRPRSASRRPRPRRSPSASARSPSSPPGARRSGTPPASPSRRRPSAAPRRTGPTPSPRWPRPRRRRPLPGRRPSPGSAGPRPSASGR